MTRLLLIAALALGGCAELKPWQRETLAHPCMTSDGREHEHGARDHMLGARESSQGATAGRGGGGCGCN